MHQSQPYYTEELLRPLADSSTIGIYIALDGKFRFVNSTFLKYAGYSEEELVGMDSLSIVYPEDRDMVREDAVKMLKGERSSPYEFRYVNKGGEILWVMESVTSVLYQGRRATFGNFMDITKRKQAEEALHESERRLKEAQIMGKIGNWEFDINTQRTEWSDEVYRLYERDKALGPPSVEEEALYYSPEEAERLREFARLAYEKGEEFEYDLTAILPSGKSKFLHATMRPITDDKGHVIRLFGTVQDITERKETEEKIKQAADEWRSTFDSIADMVSIHDKDFRIIRINKAAASALNMKPEEIVGKKCYEIFHGTTEPVPTCPHIKALKTKETAWNEFFEPHLGIHLEVTASPIFNDKGEGVASVHLTRDISERKNMQEQLMLTDRLASIGQLAAGIAHEINNPLSGVIGFSELLMEKDIPDEVREDLEIINKEAKRAVNVVKGLLTFTRSKGTEKARMDINGIIQEVLRLRSYEQRVSNIEVDTQFAPDLPYIDANGAQMQQVFMNLIVNAEQAMIEAHKRGRLKVTTEEAGDMVRISISDDGPGISPENMKRLFTPFFTTKGVGKGTGLGLSICHGIVTEHGGRIYAESGLGKGASFIVELPIETPDSGGNQQE